MKIKELKRTVNVCWSPAEHYPATIAAGSAAQQVDDSFSSNAQLELYTLNLEDPGNDLELKSSIQTQHKFQKLVWSGAGIIVGGCDGGLLQFYSAERLLKNTGDALLGSSTKHNGHVSSLDINPYQRNLLASGASDSEIFIWDLNNTSQPMAPGNRNQPLDHVQGLAWNQQVQHILGSTFATRCVVWDLRKNEPIMKLSDSVSRSRWRSLSWHPSVATQLCIASEDDQVPVVQLWDLRLAASPLVTLESHHKGVMALSWSSHDPDLLLSAGKDGRVLCWNPNNTKPGGELLLEVSQQAQWVFDVAWCPRDPALLVSASFDHQVAVHSLLGGSRPETNAHNQSNIMDSFGGVASFSQLPAVSRAPQPALAEPHQLPSPPKWLKRPVAAKFAFGGKLVMFDKCPQDAGSQKFVYISQVVSEPEIVERATELDTVLGSSLSQDPGATERLAEYCRQKGELATDQNERYMWFFLRANFLPTFRSEVLNLLGFKQDEIPSKFKSTNALQGDGTQLDHGLSRGESTETEAELSTDTSTDLSDAQTLIERKLANLDISPSISNVNIPNGEDSTSLICRALVCGNLEEAVEICLDAKRVADALIIASLGSQELLYKVQKYHLNLTAEDPVSLISGGLLQSKWERLVQGSAPSSWRQVLAALVTHTEGETLSHYCEMLGDRLCQESDPGLSGAASVCYLCAMSPEPLVARSASASASGPACARDLRSLAKLTELALLARRAAHLRGRPVQVGGKVESVVIEYASRLASQGCLQSALNTLEGIQDIRLRDRLHHALGMVHEQRRPSHQPQQYAANRTRTTSSQSQQRGHLSHHNDQPNAYGSVPHQQQFGRPSWPAPIAPIAPLAPMAPVAPVAPMAPVAPLAPIQHQPMPSMPPQPPRPESIGPQGGLTSRSKYKVDPSVQSAPLYNQYSFNNPSQPAYGFNSPLPDQYNSSSIPNTFAPINNPASVNQLNPINPLNPVNPLNPINPLNPVNPVNNVMNGAYYGQQAADAAPAQPPKNITPGWNDPPVMTSKSKAKPEAVQSQAPITHPLFGVEPPQHVPLAPQQQQYPPQAYPGQQYAQYPDPNYPPQYPPSVPNAYSQRTESPVTAEAVPAQKPPLPEEHLFLQTVFDNLRRECSDAAANPQMKRKLEDVQRRLENLYDLLREYRLSETALGSLHSCAQLAQAAELESALGVAAALATGADFAAVATFLPGLKTLLQLAAQMQLYSR